MKILIAVVACSLFVMKSQTVFAQSGFALEARGGYTLNPHSGILSSWDDGWNLGIGLQYDIFSTMKISVHTDYHLFPFHENNQIPFSPSRMPGYQYRYSGTNADMYEAALSIRLRIAKTSISPFLLITGGVYSIRTGDITRTEWIDNYPGSHKNSVIRGTGQRVNKGFLSLGIGLEVPISEYWIINVDGGFSQSIDDLDILYPMHISIQYRI